MIILSCWPLSAFALAVCVFFFAKKIVCYSSFDDSGMLVVFSVQPLFVESFVGNGWSCDLDSHNLCIKGLPSHRV